MKIGIFIGIGLLAAIAAAKEAPYEFRRRLEIVHEPNRRDAAARAKVGELELKDGVPGYGNDIFPEPHLVCASR